MPFSLDRYRLSERLGHGVVRSGQVRALNKIFALLERTCREKENKKYELDKSVWGGCESKTGARKSASTQSGKIRTWNWIRRLLTIYYCLHINGLLSVYPRLRYPRLNLRRFPV